MELIKITDPATIKNYFLKVRELRNSGNYFPVNLDDVYPLLYSRRDTAIRKLKSDFIENEDFILASSKSGASWGGVNKVDYFLSVSAMEFFVAKKVKEVFDVYREVFHKTMDEAQKPSLNFNDPDTVLMIVNNWKNEKERADILQIENNKLQTKGDIYDKVFKADVWLSGSEVCKTLGLPFGNVTFYRHLREKGIFYKGKNEPMQRFVDSGHIKLIQTFIDPKGVPVLKPVFAQKSLPGFAKMFGVVENKFSKIKTIE